MAFLGSGVCHAQFNVGFRESGEVELPVTINGNDLAFAHVGGLNTPQFSEIDLNADGTMDLFVFDRSSEIVRTFLYHPSLNEYQYTPFYEQFFPDELRDFALLRDYDCDGKMDLFTYFQASFKIFKNVGGDTPQFVKIVDKLQSNYASVTTNAHVLGGDIPAIVDVDNDGDLDILTFGSVNSENSIEFHRNTSMDLYGSCDSLTFEVVTQCWGDVEEPNGSSTLIEAQCKGVIPPGRGRQHPGSTVLLIDGDDDGDKDLIVGDIQTQRVVYAINEGDQNVATIDVNQQTNNFPNGTDPVIMPYLVAGYEIDVNHDGKQDLIMSVNNTVDSSANVQNTWYYSNSNSGAPNYSLQNKGFLTSEMVELGANTYPVSMDVNGDGDLDLLLAIGFAKYPQTSLRSKLYYFEQQTDGSLALVDDDFSSLSDFGFEEIVPSLGDLDDDGDLDLLLGVADGTLHLFRNNPIGSLANFTLALPQYMGISTIGSNAAPEIADINADGLLDLVVGDRTGILAYFQNTGSASIAQFTSAPTIANLGNIDVNPQCCSGYSAPRYVLNPAFSNAPLLFVGGDEGEIEIYLIPDDVTSAFPLVDSIVLNAGRITPLPVDFDDDGIYELLIGTEQGGIKFYSRSQNYIVGVAAQPASETWSWKMFPNPTSGDVTLQHSLLQDGKINVWNASGQLVHQQRCEVGRETVFRVADLPNGIYHVQLIEGDRSTTQSLSILR